MRASGKSAYNHAPSESVGELRFGFGKNWKSFLTLLNEERVREAERSLLTMLGRDNLHGIRFLDAGCGSGLFSLAAQRLGAREIVSFDYDPESVACARYLNEEFGPFDNWRIEQGSVLDKDWLRTLGRYDVVYCWGMLHHTGDMWTAMENVSGLVADNGVLFTSIYNDQGTKTALWKRIKRFYNASPRPVRFVMGNGFFLGTAAWMLLVDIIKRRKLWDRYSGRNHRGMGMYHDAIDWIGGYPFEAAKPEQVFRFLRDRGFILRELITKQGLGCNEFVFQRATTNAGAS
jgi:2-polyprenyl-6-hydroxyphenyl methylase/3-demethylubiquinone-9 3-methyltransferase